MSISWLLEIIKSQLMKYWSNVYSCGRWFTMLSKMVRWLQKYSPLELV